MCADLHGFLLFSAKEVNDVLHREKNLSVWLSLIIAVAALAWAGPAMGEGYLENPQEMGHESGIGMVSGFHCDAEVIEVKFDDYNPIPAAHGTTRADTAALCGNEDTGYGLLWNWNILGPGQHTVRVFADGVEFDSATFEVSTLGEEFVRGLVLRTEMMAMDVEKVFDLRWQESKQNFAIEDVEAADFTLPELVAVLSGVWSGAWHSPIGTGAISMTFGEAESGYPRVTAIQLTGTGCASNGLATGDLDDLNDPFIFGVMGDGSEVEFALQVTESFTALGGTIYFDSGPCEETDGIFYLFMDQ